MFSDTKLRRVLFGEYDGFHNVWSRGQSWIFPAKEDGDIHREIHYAGDDGLILYLLKRIEALEKRLERSKDK